jgi:hypothetical protein
VQRRLVATWASRVILGPIEVAPLYSNVRLKVGTCRIDAGMGRSSRTRLAVWT